ncbi:EAL domain-containing protein [Oceanicella sp. SM1341]|uniref:sensor domain-containing protein n=1 Tax=Oceanicella sp. SM1341 TaxID=1548889 RepID=UPI000E48C0B1|nr:EAL domain-containing protein [Oceanicella sp. SM1341]
MNSSLPPDRSSDALYRLLVNAVVDYAIFMLDPEGYVTNWNAGAERAKGYTEDEIVGRHFSCFYTPEDRANFAPRLALQTALRDGKFETEGWRMRKDGTRFWASVLIDPIFENGRHLGFAKVTRDRTAQYEAELRNRRSEQRFRLLVQGVTDYALCMLDTDGIVSNWNTGAQRAQGYSEAEIVGRHFSVFHTEEDRAAGEPARALDLALREGKYERECWQVRRDGSRFWAHLVIDPLFEADTLMGFAQITRDISRQKADADRIAAVSHRLDLALSNMSQGLCLFDRDGRLALHNVRFLEIFGVSEDQLPPESSLRDVIRLTLGPCTDAEAEAAFRRHRTLLASAPGTSVVEELRDGLILSISHRVMADGTWVTTFEDITERRRSEERILFMSRHDMLTRLSNRAHFIEGLDALIASCDPARDRVAVAAIDLDRFTDINDLHGHVAGDHVLRLVASRLGATLREDEALGRIGGDEFAAARAFRDEEELQDFVTRLEQALHGALEIEGQEIGIGASIGIAVYPADAGDRELLLNNADLAMVRAKSDIGASTCYYEPRRDEAARDRRALLQDIWSAVERDEFELVYQVQKSVQTGETTGFEALLRWNHPEHGQISPLVFIPLAEECGAILRIGEWVLRTACAEAARWDEPHRIAVNLSPVQIAHADVVPLVQRVLDETGLPPSRLELEITETAIISDRRQAIDFLQGLSAIGVSVALDDFGTGYSSLDTLRSFPFSKIKLDRSFITEIETSAQAMAIIRAVLALGRSLNISVLAEGVETDRQLAILRAERCDQVQGYLLGRPRKPVFAVAS